MELEIVKMHLVPSKVRNNTTRLEATDMFEKQE